MLVCIAATLLVFAMLRLPVHTEIQPFYGLGSLTYSPFPNTSIDKFYYNQINVTAVVADKNDFKYFNLTVCNTLCPLETVSDRLPTVIGATSNNRLKSNWYVNLRGWPSREDNSDPQYNSLYVLKGSSLAFVITRLVPLTDVQLCITNSKDICGEVFNNATNSVKAHQVCQEVLTFNKTNEQTFTVRNTSYYCAVWILKDNNQSLNYTVYRTLQSYNISTRGPPSQCQTHSKQIKTQIFDLQQQIAIKHSPVCIIIQVVGNQLHNNITLVTTVVSSKTHNVMFVLGALFAGLFVFMVTTMLVMVCLVAYERFCSC